PNPFNPSTIIEFDLPSRNNVKLYVYDILGKVVKILIDQELDAGKYSVKFNAGNLPSGVYFYCMEIDGIKLKTKKMLLLK
ncbi:MAG: T9SS type A sorting domain-containing protein, partial [Ignavibacteria bacterium]|nr:T9SS type A sorting domain-containing protein [Ignavibacteria bacterium]